MQKNRSPGGLNRLGTFMCSFVIFFAVVPYPMTPVMQYAKMDALYTFTYSVLKIDSHWMLVPRLIIILPTVQLGSGTATVFAGLV